jgi:demethylmenaquinone methyltransferase/2-methoxy-6-polyprenyl-1,4-benzoquinol methylase
MRLPRPHRYGPLARYYDALSGERALYRSGRIAAVSALRLHPGDRVLDVGCGTGLNFPHLLAAVGPAGEVTAIDASDAMLARARHRVDTHDWSQVRLVRGDAGHVAAHVHGPFDAALLTYSLAIIEDWRAAWRQILGLVRPGGRVAVVDTAFPVGLWSALAPAAWLVFAAGGVHPSRRVWELVAADCTDTTYQVTKGGHVHIAAGTTPDSVVTADDRPAGIAQ